MDITTFEGLTKPEERYHRVNVSDLVFTDTEMTIPRVGVFSITDELYNNLCRFVGISKGLNRSLRKVDKDLWEQVVRTLYEQHSSEDIAIKVQESDIIGITNYDRDPISTVKFLERAISYFEDQVDSAIQEVMYNSKNQLSGFLVLAIKEHSSPTKVFRLGAFIENDSLYATSVRLVIKFIDDVNGDHYIYGPPRIFSLNSARYDKTTDTSLDSYNNMLVTLSDRMRSDLFNVDLPARVLEAIEQESNVKITYEEYFRVRKAITKALSVSGFDQDTVAKYINDYRNIFDFFTNYPSVMESDYLWRSTAYSDKNILSARTFITELSNNVSLNYESVRDLRLLAGRLIFEEPLYRSIAIRK